jgi:hypothetical protein
VSLRRSKEKNFVCALFVADPSVTDYERMDLSRQLVATGCRYAVCAGLKCSEWDSSIDLAYLETYAELDPPDALVQAPGESPSTSSPARIMAMRSGST